ncbi:unnamed protein product [Durusdinium trenchii]|uniref:Uncharacterized protein n=1 Tax=Durusdinium trenchii TaxID=1381693 RepID=A0ABP0NX24_9DINO
MLEEQLSSKRLRELELKGSEAIGTSRWESRPFSALPKWKEISRRLVAFNEELASGEGWMINDVFGYHRRKQEAY